MHLFLLVSSIGLHLTYCFIEICNNNLLDENLSYMQLKMTCCILNKLSLMKLVIIILSFMKSLLILKMEVLISTHSQSAI